MAKRGYKLQELMAHTVNINCLSIGKKECRLFVTGGDDKKVNLWAIGKSTSLMNFCGHTSPVESLAFDMEEILLLSGTSTGVIKLWDVEEAKMVRTLTGHRSNCTSLEFHPFAEFFASGSTDTNLRIWDIRKKGCAHTYVSHTRGISAIRFTPDGRWVVSGGFDNTVKLWDLTAGKLLHDFKSHDGEIRSIDFHPIEFLLATGSADKTVKFWDLETFELIGSARSEAAGTRAIAFHPDGKSLFCGFDDSLKVFSWEPVICHDTLEMGWSTLGDICIHDGKLLGCSYYRNSVGVWVADILHIKPYEADFVPKKDEIVGQNLGALRSQSHSKLRNGSRLISRSISPNEIHEIKNIYVDSSDEKHVTPQKEVSSSSPEIIFPPDSKEANTVARETSSSRSLNSRSSTQAATRSFTVPAIVPRDRPVEKNCFDTGNGTVIFSRTRPGMLLRPDHTPRPSNYTDSVNLPVSAEYGFDTVAKRAKDPELQIVPDINTRKAPARSSDTAAIAETVDRSASPRSSSNQKGLTVSEGRTRTLVERFESHKKINSNKETSATSSAILTTRHEANRRQNCGVGRNLSPTETNDLPSGTVGRFRSRSEAEGSVFDLRRNDVPDIIYERERTQSTLKEEPQVSGRDSSSDCSTESINNLIHKHDIFLSAFKSRLTKLQVVRYFWERNDIKGAINALRRLHDPFVQADVAFILAERLDNLNLDLFSCLLPVLVNLLDSKMGRHVNLSLEMLLKLVAVFGSIIYATVSAPPVVGVDLHAEKRLEWCNQCFLQLQKIQKILPELFRKGGVVGKHARDLHLVLQQS